jgi:TetR/AcrR family transcriptional repressor of nem operon
MKAARTLYSSHGCDGTTLDDIITASGITKGAFYHYFKSKESLCEGVLDEVIEDYRAIALSIDEELEPIERLSKFLDTIAELNGSGEWVNCRLILRFSTNTFDSHPQIQRRLKSFWQWQISFYEELFEQCRQVGQISTEIDTKTQTRILMSAMAGAIMLDKAAPTKPDLGTLSATILKLLQK